MNPLCQPAAEYQHTQTGAVILILFALTAGFILMLFAWISMSVPESRAALALAVVGVLIAIALLAWYCASMTVVVTTDHLQWRFNGGAAWRLNRADIENVSVVSHPWWAGYGIRWFGPKRWAHIISGRSAVEVRLKQGGWRRLGTDDPDGLVRALQLSASASS